MTIKKDLICRYSCTKVDAGVIKSNLAKIRDISKSSINEKSIKRNENYLSNQHKHDDYDIDGSQESQSNDKVNLDEIKDLNNGENHYALICVS